MADKLSPITLSPGLFKNGTRYQAVGRWYDANLVRFIDSTIRPIGGWRRAPADDGGELDALSGVARGAVAWRSDSGEIYVGVGTHQKLYLITGGYLRDITPFGFTTGRVDTLIPGTSNQGSSPYGNGNYGLGAYGIGSTFGLEFPADTWQLDVFGDYLAAVCTSDKKLYVWEGNVLTAATVPSGAPVSATAVVCTPERFLFALGAGGNVRKIQWPSQESFDDWTPSSENTAGDFELTTNGAIKCGRRTKTQTLIWTDCDLHTATYIGGQLVYRFDPAGEACGIVAPNAVSVLDTQAFWMGREGFFVYDGFVRPLPCEVADYVFTDMNKTQVAKIWSTPVSEYGEVWWYYPSAGSTEIDRYVVYNYRENHWTTGRLARTAGVDAGAAKHPTLIAPSGEVYEHEYLDDRGTEVPYIESGPIQLGAGDHVLQLQRIIPDEKTLGDLQLTVYAAKWPTAPESTHGPYTANEPTNVRISARQIRLRGEQARETDWRLGTMSVGLVQTGRR